MYLLFIWYLNFSDKQLKTKNKPDQNKYKTETKLHISTHHCEYRIQQQNNSN